MIRLTIVAAAALALGACADSNAPTAASTSPRGPSAAASRGLDVASDDNQRTVKIFDGCDPATFNAAIGDPNTCVKKGPITFDHFVAELQRAQSAPQWRFATSEIELAPGAALQALNEGGEVHTFTRVANFGGGILPLLNDLAGTPDVAPECTTLEADDFVASGATYTAELNGDQLQKIQCCIHPWMRATVRLKSGN